ncbi:male gamete fusion factor HAP2, putative [Babesia caballi]|uniref:Male gamete fusion factor HAP2, putative n=1 Tax=Babesia caballi TaxID=5871 RepID=A0AAV4LLY1_BABCB|nr:male gamete fusion factor HAP2, putative [Babesia caballi]
MPELAPRGTHPRPGRVVVCLLAWAVAAVCRQAAAVVISPVRQCIYKGNGDVGENDCVMRSHTYLDISGGGATGNYVLRRRDNPNSGLYIHLETSVTNITYRLKYLKDVPMMYKEHNYSRTYTQMQSNCDNCDALSLDVCSLEDKVPPQLKNQIDNKVCCICGKNVEDGSPRAKFNCSGLTAGFMIGTCVSMSCLEIVGPWYSVFSPTYPPQIHRRVFVDVYAFDGDEGVIPDVAKKGYYLSDEEEDMKYLKEPMYEKNHFKFTLAMNKRTAQNDDLDVFVEFKEQGWVDGNAPELLDKLIAIPSWPKSNKIVQGSSREFDCQQDDRPPHECDQGQETQCRMERCALNARAIEKDFFDTGGSTCDKIGVSVGTWGKEGRLCNSEKNSCIQNQLAWYLSERADMARLPRVYGAQPMLARKKLNKTKVKSTQSTYGAFDWSDEDEHIARAGSPGDHVSSVQAEEEEVDEWHDDDVVHSLAYVVRKADNMRIMLNTFDATVTQIVSESVGFIVSAKVDGPCKVADGSLCNIHITTNNVGEARASFSHRVSCVDTEETGKGEIARADELSIEIEPNDSAVVVMPLNLLAKASSDTIVCTVELLSALGKSLEDFKISVSLLKPAVTVGPDVRSYDQVTDTSKEKHVLKVGKLNIDHQCHCTGFAVACFFQNFGSCMRSAFDTYYMWFVLGITLTSLLVLLPVLIPVGRFVFSRVSAIRRAARLERARLEEERLAEAQREAARRPNSSFAEAPGAWPGAESHHSGSVLEHRGDVLPRLRARLDEEQRVLLRVRARALQRLRELLARAEQVHLVGHQHHDGLVRVGHADLVHPGGGMLQAGRRGDVEDDDGARRASVVDGCDTLEALLPRRIPNVELHGGLPGGGVVGRRSRCPVARSARRVSRALAARRGAAHGVREERGADGRVRAVRELAPRQPDREAGLADRGVTQQDCLVALP